MAERAAKRWQQDDTHLGGKWWLIRMPTSGRLTYAVDNGRGITPVPLNQVPRALRQRGSL